MNTIIINITKKILLGVLVLGMVVPSINLFAATFNTHPLDFETLRVGNLTDNPNSTSASWSTYVSADAGEVINFAIYYHNTGSDTATNVRVRLSPQTTNTGSNQTFTAEVWADNAAHVSGTASVSLSSSQSITYQSGSVVWRPDQQVYGSQPLLNGQSGSELFSANGLLLGDIAPDTNTGSAQGNVVVAFTVSGSGGGGSNLPSVTTNSATNVLQSNATLNGYVNSNGTTDTTRWFEWGTTQSFGNSTNHLNQGAGATNFSETINGLSNNATYYFRAVAQNSAGTVYGGTQSFTTGSGSGNNTPSVTTQNADVVNQNVAILHGYVNPNGTTDTTRWFEWGTNSGSFNNSTTYTSQGNVASNYSDTINGLSYNTTYYYRTVAKNSAGTVYGGTQSFYTGSGNNNTNQRPFVTTNTATNVSQYNATLNGYVNPYNEYNTTRWFEWGTTQSLGNNTNHLNHGSTASNFSETITGLSNNATYYFRAVAQNQNGTTYGSILSFNTGTGGIVQQPTVVTNLATNIGQTSGRLNGLVLSNMNTFVSGWFEWGTTQSLGNTTPSKALGSDSSIAFYESLFGLSSNTTYYYRAVAQNQNTITRGNILSFRTNSAVIVPPVTPTTPSVIRDADIVKRVENIDSPNGSRTETSALRGETIRFTIEVENTGDTTLEDVEIKDRIPHYLEFANASDNTHFDGLQREVVWYVGDMREGEQVDVTLDVVVTDDARFGSIIENVAQLETKRVTRTSNDVSVDVVEHVSSFGAAALFGDGGFLPDTLLEWILLVIAILILVILGRNIYVRGNKTATV